MKDNETFLREIYEKAVIQKKEDFTQQKRNTHYFKAFGSMVIAACLIVSIGVLKHVQSPMKMGIKQEDHTPAVFSVNEPIEDSETPQVQGRAFSASPVYKIKAKVKTIIETEDGKKAVLILEEKGELGEKKEEISAFFDPQWLNISLEKGKVYQLTVEAQENTYIITGGQDGI